MLVLIVQPFGYGAVGRRGRFYPATVASRGRRTPAMRAKATVASRGRRTPAMRAKATATAIVQSKSPRLRANRMFSHLPVTCNGSPDRSACVLLRLFDKGPGFMRSGLPVHQGILIRGAM